MVINKRRVFALFFWAVKALFNLGKAEGEDVRVWYCARRVR